MTHRSSPRSFAPSDILPEEIRMLKASRAEYRRSGDKDGVEYCERQLAVCEPRRGFLAAMFSRLVAIL